MIDLNRKNVSGAAHELTSGMSKNHCWQIAESHHQPADFQTLPASLLGSQENHAVASGAAR